MAPDRVAEQRLEIVLLGVFSFSWLVASLILTGVLRVAGALELDLYTLYGVAAFLGWLSGNVYVFRQRKLTKIRYPKQLLLGYLIGPLSFIYILRSLAPRAVQHAAPFVPLYAFIVYWIFFLVPVTLRATQVKPRR